MDYFDHDEKDQKRMRNSSGLVRLYNSTDSGDDTDARVTKSLNFQKYAMADPLCPDDWVIKLQILLKT